MLRERLVLTVPLLCLLACAEPTARPAALDAGRSRPDAGGQPETDAASSPSDAGAALDAAAAPDAWVMPEPEPEPTPCPRIRVNTPGEVLNVRPTPSTSMPVIGTLPHGAIVEVLAQVRGDSIGGVDLWYQVRTGGGSGYVFSGFAVCTSDAIPTDTGYYVPFACGARIRVTQAPGGSTSHTGRSMYAYDFGVGLETPIHAMRGGTVTYVFTGTGPGDPCYSGGGPSCGSAANLVIVQHADGSTAAYKHINSASVSVGQNVRQGDVIARSGSTGYSTGPHLHAEVRAGCPTTVYCDTIRYTFTDVGSPAASTTVTSGNCP